MKHLWSIKPDTQISFTYRGKQLSGLFKKVDGFFAKVIIDGKEEKISVTTPVKMEN